jgi:16S rRNA (cytosine967-C5)-methyltransferase
VQDYNSQKVLNSLNDKLQFNQAVRVWDCCAASGGKSILMHDHFPSARLTVSDVRESILINLRKRFERAGIKSYESFIADISSKDFSSDKKFDVVICDAPCSGSGTWSRTPEQNFFFKKDKIAYYAALQKKIALNASQTVNANGWFVYITCSVFKKENEEVVDHLTANTSLQLMSTKYLKGYDKKADSLFVALFAVSREGR